MKTLEREERERETRTEGDKGRGGGEERQNGEGRRDECGRERWPQMDGWTEIGAQMER